MKTQQVFDCDGWEQAAELMPWADAIIEIEGGSMGFESSYDYQLWLAQQ